MSEESMGGEVGRQLTAAPAFFVQSSAHGRPQPARALHGAAAIFASRKPTRSDARGAADGPVEVDHGG